MVMSNINIERINYTNTDSSMGGNGTSVTFSDASSDSTADNFFLDLKSYRFSGSQSQVWSSTTSIRTYDGSTKKVWLNWGTQSGSSQQNFDIVEVSDPTRVQVLRDWETITQGGTIEIDIPSGANLTTDDVILDFKNVYTYESLNGGGWNSITRDIQSNKIIITIPNYFATNSHFDLRVLAVMPNPTRKIIINGSEPDDIKLNGVTPDKIMLNGQCYFEKPEPDPHNYLYKWDFTKSLVDEVEGAEATYYGSNAASITRDSEGIHINNTNQCIYLCSGIELVGKTVEISISDYSPVNTPKVADEILCHCDDQRIYTTSYLYYTGSSGHAWNVSGYTSSNSNGSTMKTINTTMLPTELDNSVIKFIFGSETGVSVYLNDDLIGTASNVYFNADSSHASINNLYLLGKNSNSGANNWYNMTISGVRIYENEE